MTYLRNNYDLSIILGIIMTYLRNNYDLRKNDNILLEKYRY